MSVIRYKEDFAEKYEVNGMMPHPEGEWVKYEDYRRIETQLQTQQELRDLYNKESE